VFVIEGRDYTAAGNKQQNDAKSILNSDFLSIKPENRRVFSLQNDHV